MKEFELNVVSRHSSTPGRTLKPYVLDDIDTIGVFGDEPFEIIFRNNSINNVQVVVSVDGTNVLSAKTAELSISDDMFFVRSGNKLSLKAWPETKDGGARFVFGSTKNSVAANTHGDLSNKGIIAVAIYVEGDRPKIQTNTNYSCTGAEIFGARPISEHLSRYLGRDVMEGSSRSEPIAASIPTADTILNIKSGPAVGAGETIEQRFKTVTGFVRPELDRIVRLRYVWYDDLKAKIALAEQNKVVHPTGFKPSVPVKLADLKDTPRITTGGAQDQPARVF